MLKPNTYRILDAAHEQRHRVPRGTPARKQMASDLKQRYRKRNPIRPTWYNNYVTK